MVISLSLEGVLRKKRGMTDSNGLALAIAAETEVESACPSDARAALCAARRRADRCSGKRGDRAYGRGVGLAQRPGEFFSIRSSKHWETLGHDQ